MRLHQPEKTTIVLDSPHDRHTSHARDGAGSKVSPHRLTSRLPSHEVRQTGSSAIYVSLSVYYIARTWSWAKVTISHMLSPPMGLTPSTQEPVSLGGYASDWKYFSGRRWCGCTVYIRGIRMVDSSASAVVVKRWRVTHYSITDSFTEARCAPGWPPSSAVIHTRQHGAQRAHVAPAPGLLRSARRVRTRRFVLAACSGPARVVGLTPLPPGCSRVMRFSSRALRTSRCGPSAFPRAR